MNSLFDPEDVNSYLTGLTDHDAIKKIKNSKYAESYRALINLAAKIEDDASHDGALGLACATYGWMPTILRSFSPENFNAKNPISTIKCLSSVKDAKEFVEKINDPAPINDSWVGTSKFLHFLNPDLFPIWDSKVAKNFSKIWIKWHNNQNGNEPSLQYFLNKKIYYLQYFDFIHREVPESRSWLHAISKETQERHHYTPSKVRCLELMLFDRKWKYTYPSTSSNRDVLGSRIIEKYNDGSECAG